MIIKTVPNSGVQKYFSQKADNFNPVLKSISQFYHLIGSSEPTWTVPAGVYFPTKATYVPSEYKKVRFYIGTLTNDPTSPFIWAGTAWSAYSTQFNFEGVTYKSATTLTGPNQYLQSTDFEAVKSSIVTALTDNGVLKLWDLIWSAPIRLGFYHVAVNFDLIKKEAGDLTIKSTMKKVESLLENIYVNEDVVTNQQNPIYPNYINMFGFAEGSLTPYWDLVNGYFIDYTGSDFQSMIIENYSLSKSNELNSYEIGLDIGEVSISKKGTLLGDFNPLPIIHNELKSWKPSISSFGLSVNKYAESFNLQPFQYIINKSVSTLWRPKILDPSSYKITVIDAYKPLFENYTPNKTLSKTHRYFDDYYNREVLYNFSSGVGLAGTNVRCKVIKRALDGGYFIGGVFTSYNSYPSVNIIKINVDGSVNTSFTSYFQVGPNATNINDIIEQPDGKVLIAGRFLMYGNYTISGITRLNSDGTLDGGWINPEYFPTDNRLRGVSGDIAVQSIALQGDGKVIVGGDFTTFNNNTDNKGIIRFNSNGTKDGTFDNSTGFVGGGVWSIKLLTDGNLLVGGDFVSYKGFSQQCLVRILTTGLTDTSFDLGGIGFSTTDILSPIVRSIDTNPNEDQYLIGGRFNLFTTASGTIGVAGVLMLSSTTADIVPLSRFHQKAVYNIQRVKYSDSGIYISGAFTSYDGQPVGGFVKVNSSGDISEDFITNPGVGSSNILAIEDIDDGVIIGGDFTSYNGVNHNRIYAMDLSGDQWAVYYNNPSLLTNQPLNKKAGASHEILSILNVKPNNDIKLIGSNINDKVLINITNFDGSTYTLGTFSSSSQYTGENSVWINTFCFNVNDLITPFQATQSVRFIDVNFLLEDSENINTVTSTRQRYYFDPVDSNCDTLEEDLDITPIVFKNAQGAFDIFDMESIDEMRTDRKTEEIMVPYTYLSTSTDSFMKVYSLTYQKIYNIVSRILTDEEFIWLEEIGKSKEVYILKDGNLIPINLKTFEYMTKLNTDKKISITFQFSKPEVTF